MLYLINTRTNWNESPRSRHQLANELAKLEQVIFIARSKKGNRSLEINCINSNLTIITPIFPVSTRVRYRVPFLNEFYQKWLFKKIYTFLNVDSLREIRLINFDASAYIFNKYFNQSTYYCIDEILDKRRAFIIPFIPYIAYCEKKLAKNTTFCSCVSFYLKSKMSQYNTNSICLLTASNSVYENLFDEKINRSNTSSITIGFVGFLGYKVSIKTIIQIAKEKPNWKIILIIEPNCKSITTLKKINNIVIYESKINQDLLEIISNADVCIAPLKESNFTRRHATMLNKFWIYLSIGKPIVCTKISNALLANPYIYHAETNKEFIQNIENAFSEDCIDFFNLRKNFALNNTWKQRVDELKMAFEKFSI